MSRVVKLTLGCDGSGSTTTVLPWATCASTVVPTTTTVATTATVASRRLRRNVFTNFDHDSFGVHVTVVFFTVFTVVFQNET